MGQAPDPGGKATRSSHCPRPLPFPSAPVSLFATPSGAAAGAADRFVATTTTAPTTATHSAAGRLIQAAGGAVDQQPTLGRAGPPTAPAAVDPASGPRQLRPRLVWVTGPLRSSIPAPRVHIAQRPVPFLATLSSTNSEASLYAFTPSTLFRYGAQVQAGDHHTRKASS